MEELHKCDMRRIYFGFQMAPTDWGVEIHMRAVYLFKWKLIDSSFPQIYFNKIV